MATRRWRAAPKNLAHIRLERSPADARRSGIVWSATVAATLLAGAAAGHHLTVQRLDLASLEAAAQSERQQIEQLLEQARLQLRVSEARSQELERQIDALNLKLRECQEELTFFRKAANTRH